MLKLSYDFSILSRINAFSVVYKIHEGPASACLISPSLVIGALGTLPLFHLVPSALLPESFILMVPLLETLDPVPVYLVNSHLLIEVFPM